MLLYIIVPYGVAVTIFSVRVLNEIYFRLYISLRMIVNRIMHDIIYTVSQKGREHTRVHMFTKY